MKAYAGHAETTGAYEAADAAAVAAERAANKEVGEGEAALAKLQPLFDQTRELVSAKLGITYEPSSAFRTPDDFLKAAEDRGGAEGVGRPGGVLRRRLGLLVAAPTKGGRLW